MRISDKEARVTDQIPGIHDEVGERVIKISSVLHMITHHWRLRFNIFQDCGVVLSFDL